jgi:hypothetical protein
MDGEFSNWMFPEHLTVAHQSIIKTWVLSVFCAESLNDLTFQFHGDSFQDMAFCYRTGTIPAPMQGFFLLFPELLDTWDHSLPQEQLLKDVAFSGCEIAVGIKGLTIGG